MGSDKNHVTVLTFAAHTLEVTQINLSRVPEKTLYAKSDWTPETLETKLTQIKAKFETDTLRVLLSDLTKTNKEYKELTKSASSAGLSLSLVETMKVASDLYKDPVLGLALQQADTQVDEVAEDEPIEKPTSQTSIPSPAPTGSLEEVPPQPKKNKKLFLILPIALILIVAGIYLLLSSRPQPTSELTPSPSEPAVVIVESPSPEPDVDLTEYSLQVLNGGGVAGQASVVQGLLEDSGFETIETGNADNFEYTATEVSLKSDLPAGVRSAIESALTGYDLEFQADLDEDSEYDIVIIIGTPPEE